MDRQLLLIYLNYMALYKCCIIIIITVCQKIRKYYQPYKQISDVVALSTDEDHGTCTLDPM